MKNASRYPDAALTRKKAELALSMLLTGCTDERLASFTAEGLSRGYNVPVARVEQMLAAARRRRG